MASGSRLRRDEAMKLHAPERLYGPGRMIFPLQSIRQAGSYIAVSLLGAVIVAAMIGPADLPPAGVILIGAFAGSSVLLHMALPARCVIDLERADEKAPVLAELAHQIASLGYRSAQQIDGNQRLFHPSLPAVLRWDENCIVIQSEERRLVIKGPHAALKMLHARLVKRLPMPS